MNLITDAMIPYLKPRVFNMEEMILKVLLVLQLECLMRNYDFHLAIHSNASPETMPGAFQVPISTILQLAPWDNKPQRYLQNNFRAIYPNPELVITVPSTALYELRNTIAPAVLVEVAYHDNLSDATGSRQCRCTAVAMVLSLTEYFGVPFVNP